MPIDLKRYNHLKSEVDRLQRESDKAEGALDQLMTKLEDEFECETLKQAQQKLEIMEKEATDAEREFSESMAEFEDEWSELLNQF